MKEFLEDINNEVSQATDKIPTEKFKKEKEYLFPMPDLYPLYTYLCPEKTSKVLKDSMIAHKGRKSIRNAPKTL